MVKQRAVITTTALILLGAIVAIDVAYLLRPSDLTRGLAIGGIGITIPAALFFRIYYKESVALVLALCVMFVQIALLIFASAGWPG